jgi:ribosomal protein S18 acetylase RimI-like enzyme
MCGARTSVHRFTLETRFNPQITQIPQTKNGGSENLCNLCNLWINESVDIRDLHPTDAEAAAALTPDWSVDDYAAIARGDFPDRFCLIHTGPALDALLLASVVPPDAEILNVYVHPSRRGQGIATALLRAALDRIKESHARRVWLEVRESNVAALHIYEAAGFRRTGRRAEYYPVLGKRNEDALVLETTLTMC